MHYPLQLHMYRTLHKPLILITIIFVKKILIKIIYLDAQVKNILKTAAKYRH